MIQFLLSCLQSEVSRAELCLLQAAASYPLYGRAHCITAVLQHLNTEWEQSPRLHNLPSSFISLIHMLPFFIFLWVFRSLCHTEQWRCLVSELIAVCYRLSDVVSPVVQSSSPEGLIPMDAATGAFWFFTFGDFIFCESCVWFTNRW